MPGAGTLNQLVTASVLEETVQGKIIIYLIWRGLAGFSDLLTVILKKEADGGLGKVGTDQLALVFLDLWRHLPVAGTLN